MASTAGVANRARRAPASLPCGERILRLRPPLGKDPSNRAARPVIPAWRAALRAARPGRDGGEVKVYSSQRAALLLAHSRGNRRRHTELGNMIDSAIEFFQNQTFWATTILTGLAALTYWKPKDMFKVVLILLAGGALIYVGSFLFDLTSSGIDETRNLTKDPHIDVN